MKKNPLFSITIILIILILFLASPALATVSLESHTAATAGEAGVAKVIGWVVQAVLGFVGAVLLLMFVYGGFLWVTSGGAQDKIQKGKDTIVYAIIGFMLLIGGYIVLQLVITTIIGPAPPVVVTPGSPPPSPVLPPSPSPPPPADTCGTGSYSGGSCVEKTATITGCDKLSPPQQAFSGGGCEGTANSAGKDPGDYLCCKPFPADTCPGQCVAEATDCLTLSTPMKESTGANQCETSKYATPSKPKCCEPPSGMCPWSPEPDKTGIVSLPNYANCNQTASDRCCDCSVNPGTLDRQCYEMTDFKLPTGAVYYGGYYIAYKNFPNDASKLNCGKSNSWLCAKSCVKPFMDAMIAPWDACIVTKGPTYTQSEATTCINQAWDAVSVSAPCTKHSGAVIK